MAHGTLGYGAELDDIAIAYGIVFVDGISTHIIYGGGLQVAQPVYLASLIDVFLGAIIGHLRVGLLAPAEALLDDVATLDGAASKGPGASANIAGIGDDGWWGAATGTIHDLEGKRSLGQCCDGSLSLCIGSRSSIIDGLGGLDGGLVVGFLCGL